jgi:anaerobic magnesium-protoporphyrin IX monomethyl ester cyclase
MKLSLIATPYTHPTCPPLGPAVLSAYLQKELPEMTISCFDLSLDYYLSSFNKLRKGEFGIRLYKWDEEKTAHNLEQAVIFFKNWRPDSSNLQQYHHWATIFLSFENIFNAFMTDMAEKALTGQNIPEKIKTFFTKLVQPVLAEKPDLIGFSILYEHQIVFAALLAKLIKEEQQVKVVVGGAALSVMMAPEKLLVTPLTSNNNGASKTPLKDYFDFLIPGEGELALSYLCQVKKSADLINVPNLIYFNDGELRKNPPEKVEIEPFAYPDFSGFKLDKYLTPEPILPLMTSRGCPWGKCSFCTHHHSYFRHRTRKIEECVEEIKFLQKQYKCNLFYFYDEMIPAGRFKMLAEKIIGEKLQIRYGAYAKPVKSFSYDLCTLLERSGCRVLQWGVEAASQRILDLMNKGTTIHQVETVLANAARAGIYNLAFVLFGFPSETVEELQQTLTFLDRNRENIHALSSGTFVMVEGSRIQKEPADFFVSKIWKRENSPALNPVLDFSVSKGMSAEEVWLLRKNKQNFLNKIPLSSRFGTYREHLLLYAAGQVPPVLS